MLLKEFGAYWGQVFHRVVHSTGGALRFGTKPQLGFSGGEGRDAECTVRRGIRVQVAFIQTENRALDKLNGDTRPHGLHMELLP
jgi:hypothetical protein